jgi:hypothetical protein
MNELQEQEFSLQQFTPVAVSCSGRKLSAIYVVDVLEYEYSTACGDPHERQQPL